MTPKQVVQWLIVTVIMTMIAWSVVNVSNYARLFHDSWVVWTFGLSVGIANAVSVYSFVIAEDRQQKVASVTGVVLFGGISGILQMFLYQHDKADVTTAVMFGWFGPVAEGVLSWLHAALSDHGDNIPVTIAPKAKPVTKPADKVSDKPVTKPADMSATAPSETPIVNDISPSVDVREHQSNDDKKSLSVTDRRNILRNRVGDKKPTNDDIDSWATEFAVSARTIFRDIEMLTANAPKVTSGAAAPR